MIGYKFFSSNGITWKLIHGGALPISFPNCGENISIEDAHLIRKKMGLTFLRWEDDFDSTTNVKEWWHIIKDRPDTLLSLPSKTRYMIKKGSEKFEARPVEFKIIQMYGYQVYLKSYSRYCTNERIYNAIEFKSAINNLPINTEWWGVFNKETAELVGFSENIIDNNKCFFVTMWHKPEAMKLFSSYLHFYEMEKHYLIDRGFIYVSDGARSINHKTNIHEFLITKFKYRKAYAKLRIVYNPIVFMILQIIIKLRPILLKYKYLHGTKLMVAINQEWIRQRCKN